MTPEEFHKRWTDAVVAHDADLFEDLIAPDAMISSPAFWEPKGHKDYVMMILRAVAANVDDFTYDKEWIDGKDLLYEFTGGFDDTMMRGVDRITLNDDGLLSHIEIIIRPVNALMAIAERIAKYVEEHGKGMTL